MDQNRLVRWQQWSRRNHLQILLVALVISVATLMLDFFTPLGVAAAVPYCLLVFLSLGIPGQLSIWISAGAASLLTLVGYIISPTGGVPWVVQVNRALALLVIWSVAILCHRFKAKMAEADAATKTMHEMEKIASLGQMAAGIAHELGSPLGAMQGRVEMLAMQATSPQIDSQIVLKTTTSLNELINRIAAVLQGICHLAHSSSDDPIQPTPLDRIIKEAYALAQEKFLQENVAFSIDSIDPHIEVHCRESEITQALINIINNAWDATLGQPEKWVRIEVATSQDKINIAISDSGKGIPAEFRSKIMEPFFTTKDVGQGMGLGLSIAHRIIKDHRGELSIDPQSPHTRFVLSLPRPTGSPSKQPPTKKARR